MKKKLSLIIALVLIPLCVSGCGNNTQKLEQKIKELEDKINTLEKQDTTITKEELVGTWESSSGNTITFKEDGSWRTSVYDKKENYKNHYFSYEIIGNTFIICGNIGTPIKNCFDKTYYNDGIRNFEEYPHIINVLNYQQNDDNTISTVIINGAMLEEGQQFIWTKK